MTYRPILAIDRLAHLHHSLVRLDGYSVSSSSNGMGASCYDVCVQSQLGLGSEWSATAK